VGIIFVQRKVSKKQAHDNNNNNNKNNIIIIIIMIIITNFQAWNEFRIKLFVQTDQIAKRTA